MSALIHTRGLVLHRLRYSENSLIVRIYTEKLGLRSYMVRNARSKKGGHTAALFSALAMLELVVYEREGRDLQHLREVRLEKPYLSIHFNEARHAILLFINEILYRCIREEEANPLLFSFIHEQLDQLDRPEVPVSNFHLAFLIELSRFLGFGPVNDYDTAHPYFNMREGRFAYGPSGAEGLLEPVLSQWMARLMAQGADLPNPGRGIRSALLCKLLDYYRYHLEGMGEVRSLQVLEQVFRD
ncbi:MAG: DNA repair protein RecO [Bacteroidales bacterium]|nr:DNA repair protein RecO [Bacteroidales bacterium]